MSFFKDLSISTVALALLLRWLVAQFPHSGQNSPPLYGDYEAQRHWMEITNNLPVEDWYKNTTDNDLQYWGLDYPPLTAYHMSFLGYISKNFFNSSWTDLHTSRGTETYEHKIFMRISVICADLLIYISAIIYYFAKTQPIGQYYSPPSNVHKINIAIYTALVLFYPGQILIDHGHFQYNCVFMGLVLWAVIFISKGKQITSALFFSLALCYKQMSLYYSLPFFWYIASHNLRVKPLWRGVINILLIGITVISTFSLLFLPYLINHESISQVISRIFPFHRGLFEDKVANFWFTLSIFYKYRLVYSTNQLLKASTFLTLLATIPIGFHLLFRPTLRIFKYALVNTSMVFFLSSFQVHEKTILVPALPILLLYREHPMAVNWFAIISTFSLEPLLLKDGQIIPYFVTLIMFTLVTLEIFSNHITLSMDKLISTRNLSIIIFLTSILGCFILNIITQTVMPPPRYPHIHPTVNALYSCLHFTGFLIFFYYQQFFGPSEKRLKDKIQLAKKVK